MNLYVMDHHHQLLHLWQELSVRNLDVTHIDFHCDMRGLLIDRNHLSARWITKDTHSIDEGNFLAHAIMNQMVDHLTWVHDEPGGRQYDVGGVMYENDLGRWLPWNTTSIELKTDIAQLQQYNELPIRDWPGPAENQWLDIDWDTFAANEIPYNSIQNRVDSFVAKLENSKVSPGSISICYSPGFSHPSREPFNTLVESLERLYETKAQILKFDAREEPTPQSFKHWIPRSLRHYAKSLSVECQRGLRRAGIYL